jgi:putative sterol carrier protein
MSVQLQANKPLATVSPADIFDKALPKAFEVLQKHLKGKTTTYTVTIFGEGGGSWVIDLAAAAVRKGADEKTSCTLEMGMAEFGQLTAGKLDVPAAMTSGKMRFSGNPADLTTLGQLLAG